MTTKTLGVLVFAVCGLMVLVGLVSPKPVLSDTPDGYGSVATFDGSVRSVARN